MLDKSNWPWPLKYHAVSRLCVRGNHRGDISLTERSVSLLRRRAPGLTQLGDCFTWSLQATGAGPR